MSDREMRQGDLVSRDGTDVHCVMRVTDDAYAGDFACLVAPRSGWTEVGRLEHNVTRRYSVVCTVEERELEIERVITASVRRVLGNEAWLRALLQAAGELGVEGHSDDVELNLRTVIAERLTKSLVDKLSSEDPSQWDAEAHYWAAMYRCPDCAAPPGRMCIIGKHHESRLLFARATRAEGLGRASDGESIK